MHRATGDLARDQGDWASAERAYRQHLDEWPEDSAIWIQYGHSLKEQGKHSEAESAYLTALSITPDDADAYLQLGHALKLQNRIGEAGEAYARSAELKPTRAALDELLALGRSTSTGDEVMSPLPSLSQDMIFFEIDDLVGYLSAHTTLSGIQRVQVGIVERLLADSSPESARYAFVRSRSDSQSLWQFDVGALKSLIAYCNSRHVERGRLNALLNALEQGAMAVQPASGTCYFVMGAFWGFNGDATRYAKLKARGVSVGVYIYDLIPLTHPEYCDAHLVSDFALSFGDGMAVFDFVLTISEYSANEVRSYIARHGLRPIPVQAVVLAHVLSDTPKAKPDRTAVWSGQLAGLKGRPFVLSVSTIEARKNHAYLIGVWKLLLQEGVDPPDLVFVGRYGWRVNDLMEQLRSTGYMAGRVHVLHDLSDSEMEVLYSNCLFTAFPSFVEGWGLPVGESLTHGKVCVASNTSSIPEVGGDLVDYIDPYSIRDGVAVFRRLITDEVYREERRRNIQTGFKPRSWQTVTEDLLHRVSEHRLNDAVGWQAPLLRSGEVFRPGELRLGQVTPANYPSRPLRLMLADGWFPAEDFGVWMKGRLALLRFATGLKPDTDVVVYFKLAGSPSHSNAVMKIFPGTSLPAREPQVAFPSPALPPFACGPISNNAPFTARVAGRVDARGEVSLQLVVEGTINLVDEVDTRLLALGLIAVAYAPRADGATRADIVDALM